MPFDQGNIVPLFGESMASKSRVVSVQRRLNCYFETRPDGDKTEIACFGRPGLKPAFRLQTASSAPARAMFGTPQSLYVAVDDQFQQINPFDGSVLFTGQLVTASGPCEFATNGTQVLLVDGASGYIYQNGKFMQLSPPFPLGATSITFVSGFFIANSPGTQQFFQSDANDGSTWDGLQFGSASAYPDNLLAVDNNLGNAVFFSDQHIEFWQNVGSTPLAFQPILSAVSEYGLAAAGSRAHVQSGICFLAQNREGQIQVARITGFTVQVISTTDLDDILNAMPIVADAVGGFFGAGAHKFYLLTFPTANRSFMWDATSGLWSEVQTGLSQTTARLNAQYSAYFGGVLGVSDHGVTYLSDPQTNQMYTMDGSTYSDDAVPFAVEVVTRHVSRRFNRFFPSRLYLDMETGTNATVMLQYSKDNGRTWGPERWKSTGGLGHYRARVRWNRFGCTRDATWRIRQTDPAKFVIAQAALKLR